MREPLSVERQQSDSTLFLYAYIETLICIVGSSYANQNLNFMSNKKHVFLLLIPLMLIGCASSKKVAYHVSQSAWVNASVGEVDNISASVVTTLLFTSDKDVTVMSSVKKNAETIVKPFVYAKGT